MVKLLNGFKSKPSLSKNSLALKNSIIKLIENNKDCDTANRKDLEEILISVGVQ